MIDTIHAIIQPSLNVILYGYNDVSLNENKTIFDAVHPFVRESKRFHKRWIPVNQQPTHHTAPRPT